MTSEQPPHIATWMLRHFGSGRDTDAVLGDLAEQFLHKRSAVWYWRQVLRAIQVSFFNQIRARKGTAAGAFVTGWMLWILCGSLIFPFVFFGTNLGYYFETRHPVAAAWSFMWMPVLGPGSHPVPLAFATALPLLAGAICGWLAARWQICIQRQRPAVRICRVDSDLRTGIVLQLAASILLVDLLLLGSFVASLGAGAAYFFGARLAANIGASVLGILFGGGLLRKHSRPA